MKKAVEELTEEEIAACDAAANDKLTAATIKNAADGDGDSKLDDWLFESKKEGEGDDKKTVYQRKANDVKDFNDAVNVVTEGDNKYQKVTSTYAAYMFLSGMHRNDDPVRDVGHILFKSQTFDGKTSTDAYSGATKELADKILARDGTITAYAMAGELLDQLKAEGKITEVTEGDKTYYKIDKAVFEEYGELFTEDSSVFYNGVYKGQMVAEFENWLFDAARKEGEITYPEPIKTTYGYHIMFYTGVQSENWFSTAKNELASEEHTAYLEGVQETYAVTVESGNFKYIG